MHGAKLSLGNQLNLHPKKKQMTGNGTMKNRESSPTPTLICPTASCACNILRAFDGLHSDAIFVEPR